MLSGFGVNDIKLSLNILLGIITMLNLIASKSSHSARRSLTANKENHQSTESTRSDNIFYFIVGILYSISIIYRNIDIFGDSKDRLDKKYKYVLWSKLRKISTPRNPYSPNLRPGKNSPIGLLHCPVFRLM